MDSSPSHLNRAFIVFRVVIWPRVRPAERRGEKKQSKARAPVSERYSETCTVNKEGRELVRGQKPRKTVSLNQQQIKIVDSVKYRIK